MKGIPRPRLIEDAHYSMTLDEVAQQMGTSRQYVQALQMRALAKLRAAGVLLEFAPEHLTRKQAP